MPNKKPPVDLSQALVPIAHFRPDAVPKAGHDELVAYRSRREKRLEEAGLGTLAMGVLGVLSYLIYTIGFPAIGIFLALAAAADGVYVLMKFSLLALGEKAYQALPEHATEKTAKREDATRKLLFPWNGDTSVWNEEAKRWNAKAAYWNGLKPGDIIDDVEMTGELLVLEGKALIEEKHRLLLEREELVRRQNGIQDAIDELSIPKRLATRREPKMLPAPKKK